MAKWTDEIHEEWITNLLADRPDLGREKLERTKNLMNEAVPDCLVSDYERFIPTIDLPDPNDRHVVAAAIQSRANAIITFNLTDFPEEALKPLDLEAIHPDDFIKYQFDLDNAAVLVSARNCRERLRNPSVDVETYLRVLRTQSLPKTVDRLSDYATIL